MQYTTEASTDGCVTWMQTAEGALTSRKKTPLWVPKIRCKHFGEFTFSRAIAAHTNSTNTLEFCTACSRDPVPTVHYTLAGGDEKNPKGMLHHWRTKHPTLEIPAELKAKVTLADKERKGILGVGKAPPVARDSAGKAAAHAAAVAQAAAVEAAMQQATALVAAHVGGVAGGDADGAVNAGAARA